ncbi:hypothetical protein AC578_1558 [Pseudocercospora eumusae]|uniref:Myb-like domain-containing protein n=1 Tax=Pseudocercospora eumusae TaxID=321146 RepID=A0A139HLN3_9PEZI|nr:hypothetical protein AC578_1558 [Pseudocercospora eumusae]KXT03422.1 hypothetical protein AC578_1558 [Pseudocercospora eumusae]
MSDAGSNQEYQPDKEKPKRKSTKGRTLMRWSPDEDQLALLCVDYIATTEGVPLDWDKVANVISHTVSGEAIKQHMFKLRKAREEAGLPVPPAIDRKSARKARNMLNGGMPCATPARGRKRKSEIIPEEDEGGFDDATVLAKPKGTSVNKSGSLLYSKPSKRAMTIKAKNAAAAAAAANKQENEFKNEPKSDSDGIEIAVPAKKLKGKKNRRAGPTNLGPVSSAPSFLETSAVSAAPTYYAFAASDQTNGITMPQQQMGPEDAKMHTEEEQNLAQAPYGDAVWASELPTTMSYDYGMAGEPVLPSFGEMPFAHTNGLSLFTGSYESVDYSGGSEHSGTSFGGGMPEAPRLEWLGDSFTSGEEQGDFGMYGGEDLDPLFPGVL